MSIHRIASDLLGWYQKNKRELPWRQTREPYPVWISEVILQQTRVAQGLPYFQTFMSTFPSVEDLANASETDVLRIWEGLGYYSRARNLHAGAKYISEICNGIFPSRYDELLKVKGIGPYTAAAIASICFDQPTPVLDGNVFRVVSRVFDIDADIAKSSSRKIFLEVLNDIISTQTPGDFNQGMMELGATVCTPQSPSCDSCPLNNVCLAFKDKKQSQLPVKSKTIKIKKRYFHYLVIKGRNQLCMKMRKEKDIWQGLYEFHQEGQIGSSFSPGFVEKTKNLGNLITSRPYEHILTHQRIFAQFHLLEVDSEEILKNLAEQYDLNVFSLSDIVALPKPKLIVNYLTECNF